MSSATGPGRSIHHWLFALTVFLSAFLLFQVQPLISKYILPWFGGSPAVWSTCMLFFQVTLFAGYLYAHFVSTKLSPRGQAMLHAVLLGAAALLLPITPDDAWRPTGHDEHPILRIVALLTASVGLPYFVLSTTGPLLQRWFSQQSPGTSPYRLYALSNAGSLLALISYPFAFEPALHSTAQASLWSAGFLIFGIGCIFCARGQLHLKAQAATTTADETEAVAPNWSDRALWFTLAMVASVMLLATTNQVCMDVATVPFLWIVPLTIYLMSFILTFDGDRWYSRKWYLVLLMLSMLGVVRMLLTGPMVSIVVQVGIYLAALFFCCMVCHGELARQRPGSKHLTSFYLLMSAGGAAGGLFVGLLAPYVFPSYWELHVGIVACFIATLAVLFRDKASYLHAGQPRAAWLLIGAWGLIMTLALQSHAREALHGALAVSRNFYGVLRVEDDLTERPEMNRRGLFHGSILHGTQFLAPERRQQPTTYYGPQSGAGLILKTHRAGQPRRIGIVGLGVGTLCAYGQPQDTFRCYEINPEVIRLARDYFTFLSDTPARTEMITGDARLSLEHEPPQNYDVLVLDAFSGDAIPTHLLTREAADLYLRHLQNDGVLCVHISNLHFDLRPVVQGLARHLDMHCVCLQAAANEEQGTSLCHWMLLSRQPLSSDVLTSAEKLDRPSDRTLLWTDEWSNLLSVLR